jgi:hypothetical protein
MAACECVSFCTAFWSDAAVCVEQTGSWTNMHQNFDNIWVAILSLFEIITTEGWVDLMYAATDAIAPMRNPSRDYDKKWSLYFVVFIFFGSFFILNLCVGVIVDNFSQIKEDEGVGSDSLLLTDAQREAQSKWKEANTVLSMERVLFGLTNLQQFDCFRRRVYYLTTHKRFEQFIMGCIILSTGIMAMTEFPARREPDTFPVTLTPMSMEDTVASVVGVLNNVFAGIFTLEAAMKIYATRAMYFRERWNQFDFFCVTTTLAELVIGGNSLRSFRMFRIARLVRLIRFAKGLNKLISAFIVSIPKLMNVIWVLLLLLFLFSVMGMHMFALCHEHGPHNAHAHFRTFSKSLLTLIRFMTGEAWNEIMHSLGKTSYDFGHVMGAPCIDDFDITVDNYKSLDDRCLLTNPVACGKPKSATFFFVAYTCVITFIILNLFVAVVLEGFDDSNSGDDDVTVERCVEVWKKFDPDLTMKLPWLKATVFVDAALRSLQGGASSESTEKKQTRFAVQHAEISRMEIDEQGEVSFKSATLAVLRLLMPTEELVGVLKLQDVAEKEEEFINDRNDIRAQVAALALQSAFKKRKESRLKAAGTSGSEASRKESAAGEPSQADSGGNATETLVGAVSTPGTSPERDDSHGGARYVAKPKEVSDVDALPPRDLPPGVLSPDKLRELEEKRGEPDAAG